MRISPPTKASDEIESCKDSVEHGAQQISLRHFSSPMNDSFHFSTDIMIDIEGTNLWALMSGEILQRVGMHADAVHFLRTVTFDHHPDM